MAKTTQHRDEVDYLLIDRIHPKNRGVRLPVSEAPDWFRCGFCIDPATGEHYELQKMHFAGSDHGGTWASVRWRRDRAGAVSQVVVENNRTPYVTFDYTDGATGH